MSIDDSLRNKNIEFYRSSSYRKIFESDSPCALSPPRQVHECGQRVKTPSTHDNNDSPRFISTAFWNSAQHDDRQLCCFCLSSKNNQPRPNYLRCINYSVSNVHKNEKLDEPKRFSSNEPIDISGYLIFVTTSRHSLQVKLYGKRKNIFLRGSLH